MTTSAVIDLEMDQGADWAIQLYWTTTDNVPYSLQSPMRMEIRDKVGGVAAVLQTDDHAGDVDAGSEASILYQAEVGLIQLQLTSDETNSIGSGVYEYDLFVSYLDNAVTGRVRTKRLISGNVLVNGRVTQGLG
jgi:hypothetical protein